MKGIAIIGNKKKTYTIVLVVIQAKKPRGQKLNTKTPFNRIKKKKRFPRKRNSMVSN